MRLHTKECTDTVRESALKVDSGEKKKNPLPHRGIEPTSAACRYDALTNWAASPPNPHSILCYSLGLSLSKCPKAVIRCTSSAQRVPETRHDDPKTFHTKRSTIVKRIVIVKQFFLPRLAWWESFLRQLISRPKWLLPRQFLKPVICNGSYWWGWKCLVFYNQKTDKKYRKINSIPAR